MRACAQTCSSVPSCSGRAVFNHNAIYRQVISTRRWLKRAPGTVVRVLQQKPAAAEQPPLSSTPSLKLPISPATTHSSSDGSDFEEDSINRAHNAVKDSLSGATSSDEGASSQPNVDAQARQQAAILFDSHHINQWNPLLALYFPFGCLLAAFRMSLWILGIALDQRWFRNEAVVRGYLKLLGYSVKWVNEERLPKGRHVMVSNHVSVGDLMVLFTRHTSTKRYTHLITPGLPQAVTKTRHLPTELRAASPQSIDELASEGTSVDRWVHVFPEGGMTNGAAMLAFSRGFMRMVGKGVPVVPVSLKLITPGFEHVRSHTLTSHFLENLFWFSFYPSVTVEAVVHPPMEPSAEEGRGAFVQRVQQAIADTLGTPISSLTIQQKRRLLQEKQQQQKRRK